MQKRITVALGMAFACCMAGCATRPTIDEPGYGPAQVRERLVRLLPQKLKDRSGWAADIQVAFSALEIEPSDSNLCSALAVTEQESGFVADPIVPNLARIARKEIDSRAARYHIPEFALNAALHLKSASGQRYDARLAAVRSERDLSLVYEDLIASVPLGKRLFSDSNPVRTGGPMQVSIAFAEQHAREQGYPYPIEESVRREVFTRRGGLYFGIAHLLGYVARYDNPIYRFADFNAGWYASRNAAFQKALSLASGIPLALDGDLVRLQTGVDGSRIGATELAVRSLGAKLDLSDSRIRRDLEKGDTLAFEKTDTYERVFEFAEKIENRALARAVIPQIKLESPKITRQLTTQWFAERVDGRFQRCMKDARKLDATGKSPSRQ